MMTNKLYELEKQARDYADLVPGSMYEKRIWTNHFQSKYAELIIQECMNINDEFVGHRIGEIDLNLAYKEHFGIE